MRIALYVPSWPPGFMPNGIVTYASHLVPALRKLGHEVFVLTADRRADTDAHLVDLPDGGKPLGIWGRVARKVAPNAAIYRRRSSDIVTALRNLVLQHSIDICQIEDSFGWSYAVSRLRILPVVVRLHGPWFLSGQFDAERGSPAMRGRIRREGRAIRAATAITAPSKNVLDATAEYYGLRFPLAKVIPNAIDLAGTGNTWDAARADRNRLLFVGRFDRTKGGDIVLRAFARLGGQFPGLRLSFVGPDSGLSESGDARRHLQTFLGAPLFDGVRSRIDYLGVLNATAIRALRSTAFLTIVASRYETFGNVVLEAMAAGSPLVATAAGGIPEIVQDGRNGLLVPSEDSDGLASACHRLLQDPDLAARLGRQALQDCLEKHQPMVMARATAAFYESAISRARGPGA